MSKNATASTKRALTELDCTVLAVIDRDGPLSAYDVRKDFAESLTPTWSSSTGSIYPSIRRLVEGGFVRASAPEGIRGKQKLRITSAGRAAVSEWITTMTIDTAAPNPDPIRTRAHFLRALNPKARRKFLQEAQANTDAAIATAEQRHQERVAAASSKQDYLPGLGVLYELRARRDWLALMAEELS